MFSPLTLGDLELPNRVVMAPLTRLRSGEDGVPGPLVAEHYAQRAGFGLLVAEGTYPSPESRGYPGQPGIVTDAQVDGWRAVTAAVHARGGRIVLQVMHAGRVSHPAITGTPHVVAPSAVAIRGEVHTPGGKLPYPVPHALSTEEVRATVRDLVAASRRALDAGFDGVELHSANGYLLHEFLSPAANRRDDSYGGTPGHRARLPLEAATAIAAEVGAGRVGVRISPAHGIQDAFEPDAADVLATYGTLVDGLAGLDLAYLSVLHAEPAGDLVQDLRRRFRGPLVANSGFGAVTTREDAVALVESGAADAVAVGRMAIANPDLVQRWAGQHAENEPDASTFYTDGARGYTDYPFLADARQGV
nr:alkene reductase [Kineococcus siccus]